MVRKLMMIMAFSLIIITRVEDCLGAPLADDLPQALNHIEYEVTQGKDLSEPLSESLRDEAISRAAVVYGAQSGRYYRWKHIDLLLFNRAHLLSRVFNFRAMYLDHGLIQPPVLDMSSRVIKLSNRGQMRELINNVYRVLIPASFKSTPITWQSFLLPDHLSMPVSPRVVLLPRNNHEKSLWVANLRKGWQQGVLAANSEYDTRLDSLHQAYQGMVLYTQLAMRGMVAPPRVVDTQQSVAHATNGQTMAVGIHKQVIARNSYFVAKPNHWKPVYYHHAFSFQGTRS